MSPSGSLLIPRLLKMSRKTLDTACYSVYSLLTCLSEDGAISHATNQMLGGRSQGLRERCQVTMGAKEAVQLSPVTPRYHLHSEIPLEGSGQLGHSPAEGEPLGSKAQDRDTQPNPSDNSLGKHIISSFVLLKTLSRCFMYCFF